MRSTRKWGVAVTLLTGVAAVAALAASMGGSAGRDQRAHRDRLGLRQDGPNGPRQSGARHRQDPNQRAERQERRQRGASCGSIRATRRTTLRHARSRARGSSSPRARTSSSRPATSTSRRQSSRRRSTAASWRSRPASAPTRWGRSVSAGSRDALRSASATSRRTRAWRWPSTRSGAVGRRPASDEHAARLLQERHPGVRQALRAARWEGRRPGELRHGREQRAARRDEAQYEESRRLRIVDRVREPCLRLGFRTLGNQTPILNSWAGDGTYWVTNTPKVTNYYAVTYASILRRRPEPEDQPPREAGQAGTGGFVQGIGTIDGIVEAIKRANGSTNGLVLARTLEGFRKVPTTGGRISFSRNLQRVRRQYRVIKVPATREAASDS